MPDADLSWRYTFGRVGPDFVLIRARSGDEPETIGRVKTELRSAHADKREVWTWSLTCFHLPNHPPRVTPVTSGIEDTDRAARDALVAAWRREEAWRAEMRARPDFHELSPYTRAFVTHGQPVPAKRVPGACGFPDSF